MAKVTNRPTRLFLEENCLAGKSVAEMDKWIKENWKYFSSSGYSTCSTNIKNKFSGIKNPTLHNCVGWYHGRKNYMEGATSTFVAKGCGNPYEMYQTCKANTNKMTHGGVSQTPEVGAAIIWGKASASDGSSRSHIAMVEKIEGDYIWISEDNYNTVRTYNGVRSRNGVRKIKKNSELSSSYPFVGYILPPYKYVGSITWKATVNLRVRSAAGTNNNIVNRMVKGETCKYYGIYKTVGNQLWYCVEFGSTIGWICAKEGNVYYVEAV